MPQRCAISINAVTPLERRWASFASLRIYCSHARFSLVIAGNKEYQLFSFDVLFLGVLCAGTCVLLEWVPK